MKSPSIEYELNLFNPVQARLQSRRAPTISLSHLICLSFCTLEATGQSLHGFLSLVLSSHCCVTTTVREDLYAFLHLSR
jgi:hypothetical protein